jgi:hypothetical protein
MKIRQDFVTNSSSTSFVISMKGDFTFDNFLDVLKIDTNSCFSDIMEEIFNVIDSNKSELIYLDTRGQIYKNLDKVFYDAEVTIAKNCYNILKELISNKRKIYIGLFHDDESAAEYFLCNTFIDINNDDIYFYSVNGY